MILAKTRWSLEYNNGQKSKEISCWEMALQDSLTYFLDDAGFNASGMDYDFEIKALEGDAVIKFVRIIKI